MYTVMHGELGCILLSFSRPLIVVLLSQRLLQKLFSGFSVACRTKKYPHVTECFDSS